MPQGLCVPENRVHDKKVASLGLGGQSPAGRNGKMQREKLENLPSPRAGVLSWENRGLSILDRYAVEGSTGYPYGREGHGV